MRSLLGAVVRFWREPIPAEPLALFRIVAATTVLAGVLTGIAPNLALYWYEDGLIPRAVVEEYLRQSSRVSVLTWMPFSGWVNLCFGVWVLSLVTLALGLFTRTSAAVAWVLAASFNHRAVWVLNGGDDVAVQLLFYLALSPAGAVWSLDARRRQSACGGRGAGGRSVRIAPWSVRLIQIQLCCIYVCTGFSKLEPKLTTEWLTGEAFYWVLNDVSLVRWPYAALPLPLVLCRLVSWATLVFEIGFPLLVASRRLRPWTLGAGVAFHLGIVVFMEVGWFSQNTLAYYAVFLPLGTRRSVEGHGQQEAARVGEVQSAVRDGR